MRSRFPFGARIGPLVVAALVLAGCHGKSAEPDARRPVLVEQPAAAGGAYSAYAGEVRAREESPLSFRVGGNLLERKVDVGDHVRAGDVLAVLDAGDLSAQARAAQAQLAAAEAELGRARADQKRYATLGQDQLVSRSAIDAQNAAAVAAAGRANAARANLDVARNQARYAQLRAPRAGVIAARQAEAGQVVAPGQAVFVLAADGSREIAFAVAEGTVSEIKPGQPVQVEVWSQPGQRWPGKIRELSPAADPASRTFAARVVVDAPAGTFELGQSARVYLAGNGNGALSVPLAAVQRSDKGGSAVYVVDPRTSTLRLQPVVLGRFGQERVPVRSGVGSTDWIVVAGGHLLQPGQPVRPVDRDNRPVKLDTAATAVNVTAQR